MLERQVEVAEQKVKIAEEKLALYRHQILMKNVLNPNIVGLGVGGSESTVLYKKRITTGLQQPRLVTMPIPIELEKELNMQTPENLEAQPLVEFELNRLQNLKIKLDSISNKRMVIVRKPSKNVPMYVEAVRLGAGRSFGEQALLKSASE